jgi:hypothetical protein
MYFRKNSEMRMYAGGQESCDIVLFDKSIIFLSLKIILPIVTSRFNTALMKKNKESESNI